MEGTRVRRLERRDIRDAIRLTDLEGWGLTPGDFRRLLDLSPDGCFAAELGGEVVGVLTTTTYDRLAFLGAVIVRPELRGRGVGRRMMEAALDHLRAAGVRTVRLNAYLRAVHFYETLGFEREYEVVRWHGGAASGPAGRVRPVRVGDLDGLARFDTTFFGADRTRLLRRLAEEFPESFLMSERGGRPRGYIVGNVDGGSCEIGPWVVEPDAADVTDHLFRGLIAATGATSIALSGPSRNEALVGFVEVMRYGEVFRTLRMRWGDDAFPGDEAGIWALGGLEKG